MLEVAAVRPSTATMAIALMAAATAIPTQYPQREERVQLRQIRGTYSDFHVRMSKRHQGREDFAGKISTIYTTLASRQQRLGADFEAAIFDDLDSLYEV
jgi:hypothetical protein